MSAPLRNHELPEPPPVSRPENMDAAQRMVVAPHIAIDEAVLAVMRLRPPKLPAEAAPGSSSRRILKPMRARATSTSMTLTLTN